MPFQKGNQYGNRKGRPKLGDSLAELIRQSGSRDRRKALLDRMWADATSAEDGHLRVKAAEWLAKHGWPEEARGTTTVKTEGGVTTVTHVHQP